MANNKTEASPGVLSFQMTNEKKKNSCVGRYQFSTVFYRFWRIGKTGHYFFFIAMKEFDFEV